MITFQEKIAEAMQMTFDERAVRYTEITNLLPQTYKGDVETAYTIACIEQQGIDKSFYLPYIKMLESIARWYKEQQRERYLVLPDPIENFFDLLNKKRAKIPYNMIMADDELGQENLPL